MHFTSKGTESNWKRAIKKTEEMTPYADVFNCKCRFYYVFSVLIDSFPFVEQEFCSSRVIPAQMHTEAFIGFVFVLSVG